MNFGDNLKKIRKSRKISQEDLASKVNVSRQSVSKWETGESYPEMNNILELCKIFHCHINDLVNDHIIDLDSLDEEIKMNVVKFKSNQQRKMKGLSKAIAIIAKIGRILCLVSIPIIVATMCILGVLINKVEISDNEIRFEGVNEKIIIVENFEQNRIELNGKAIEDKESQNIILKTREILEHKSKYVLLGYLETGFAFLILFIILFSIILKYLEKLFININKGDTPFTLENVEAIKKMAYLLIVTIILPNIIGVFFEMFLKTDLEVGFEIFNLIEILFLFSMAYIFQYGYEIQLDSKGKMYGEQNE